jgi:hypothetical protein
VGRRFNSSGAGMASYLLIESRNIFAIGEVAFCHDPARLLPSAGNRDTRFPCGTASCRRERKPWRRNSRSSRRPGSKFSPTISCCESEEFVPIVVEPPRSGARAEGPQSAPRAAPSWGRQFAGFLRFSDNHTFSAIFGSALPVSDSAVRGFPSSFPT